MGPASGLLSSVVLQAPSPPARALGYANGKGAHKARVSGWEGPEVTGPHLPSAWSPEAAVRNQTETPHSLHGV